ncbi:unnamed protein product [marine sediment metagenome]|uniref:Uncharacterized protein n=1 Tax=marine sediment metagenome TaxID=412755 RepID=X0VND0_9ZZZZ
MVYVPKGIRKDGLPDLRYRLSKAIQFLEEVLDEVIDHCNSQCDC